MPVDEMNETVLSAIEDHALTPEAVHSVIRLTERDDLRERQTALTNELASTESRVKRLVDLIESGDNVQPLLDRLRELEARRSAILVDLRDLQPLPQVRPEAVETQLSD